MIRILLAESI